jgi:hypothetical protein
MSGAEAREDAVSRIQRSGELRFGHDLGLGWRWLASLVGVLALVGCAGNEDPASPEVALNRFVAVARGGDRAGVYQRLGPATRACIESLQDVSGRQAGRLTLKPEDFLSVGWAPPAWEMSSTRTLRRDETSAEVEVFSPTGERHTVSLVRENGIWKVELPGR